ncbi:MAG: hypothetical protein CVV13_05305 [Gammaproteobacteria bacterium HGW-Gammaproteobacteria-3]|nr:MAG: hypothetical protein CVV13_05305 [Gammaproteobacteria bacterium HGW-Gammaproteobacteria-3]
MHGQSKCSQEDNKVKQFMSQSLILQMRCSLRHYKTTLQKKRPKMGRLKCVMKAPEAYKL